MPHSGANKLDIHGTEADFKERRDEKAFAERCVRCCDSVGSELCLGSSEWFAEKRRL
jgi:hypothetical protein